MKTTTSFIVLFVVVACAASLGCRQSRPTGDSGPTGSSKSSEAATASQADRKIVEALAQLPADDRVAAEQQKTCPVSGEPLGSMGVPVKIHVAGRDVFICCEGCREDLVNNPDKYLKPQEETPSGDSGEQQKADETNAHTKPQSP